MNCSFLHLLLKKALGDGVGGSTAPFLPRPPSSVSIFISPPLPMFFLIQQPGISCHFSLSSWVLPLVLAFPAFLRDINSTCLFPSGSSRT